MQVKETRGQFNNCPHFLPFHDSDAIITLLRKKIMATWRAKCWLGSANGFQELEVQSNTVHGADEQLRRIYGAEQVINLRQVNESKGSTSSSDASSLFPFAIVLLLIWLMIEYWYIFIPIFVILVILFLIGSTDD